MDMGPGPRSKGQGTAGPQAPTRQLLRPWSRAYMLHGWTYVHLKPWAPQGNRQGNIITNFKPIRICFAIFRSFIKFGIMGWVWIGFALLNTFANCVCLSFFLRFWLFLDIYIYIYITNYILHITYYILPIDCLLIAYRLPLMPICSAIIDMGLGPGPISIMAEHMGIKGTR